MLDEKKTQVALYCRLAHADEAKMEEQIQALRSYAAQKGYAHCATYIDNGESGISADRPALNRLNEDIRAGHIKTVLVQDVARLFRDFVLFGKWLGDMKPYGLAIISVADGELNDLLVPLFGLPKPA